MIRGAESSTSITVQDYKEDDVESILEEYFKWSY